MQILFLITLLGLLVPKSKILACIEIIAMSLFYGGYNGTIDLPNYIWQYENDWMIDDSPLQKLYFFMGIFFHNIGISFEGYHLIITAISLMLISYVIFKLTDQIAYVLSMISVFVYFENGWQLKTMMATCFIVVALYWFYKRIYISRFNTVKKNTDVLIFLALLFIAAQFHFLSVFFLLFLLMSFFKGHFARVMALDICSLAFIGTLMVQISSYIPMIENYISPISFSVFLITALWQILGYFILFGYNNSNELKTEDKFGLFVKDGSLVVMLLIPFYYYANVATRIYRIWIIFMIIYAAKLYRKHFVFDKKRILFDIYIIGSSMFWFYIMFKIQGNDPLIYELLNNNIFLVNDILI